MITLAACLFFCNPCERAELHQEKARAKLYSATSKTMVLLARMASSKNLTQFKTIEFQNHTLLAKIDTLFKTKTAKNHTLWGRTYPYSPYKGVQPPPPPGLNKTAACPA